MLLYSLKARIILFTVLIVTASSFLFALALLLIKDRLEETTFGNMAREQMQLILDSDMRNPIFDNELLSGWQFYFGDDVSMLPGAIRSLQPGSHHSVQVDEKYYQVEIQQHTGRDAYLTYDITDWENQEHAVLNLLGYGVALVLIAAVGIGLLIAKASLTPLASLTRRLSAIQPDERELRISDEYQGHEVGSIAREFDRYLARLDDFVEREKFFSAAASHELRTPLSVVMGAVDVIEAQNHAGSTDRAVQRIRRACAEMLAFIEATLFLSREETNFADESGESFPAKVIAELLDENSEILKQRDIEVKTSLDTSLRLPQSPSIIKIATGNLMRNALEHTRNGTISINLNDDGLTISDSGEGVAAENLAKVFDRNFTTKPGGTGLGLNLVRKICERFRWPLTLDSKSGQGTTVKIEFEFLP